MSALRRLVLPLGLSLGLHLVVGVLAWWLPTTTHTEAKGVAPGTSGLSSGWQVDFSIPRRTRPSSISVLEPNEVAIVPYDPGIAVTLSNPTETGHGNSGGSTNSLPGGGSFAGGSPTPGPSSILQPGKQARRVAYVIDRSVSMGLSGAIKQAVEEVSLSLRQLQPGVSFLILTYNKSAPSLLPGGWHLADERSLSEVTMRLEELIEHTNGGTDHVLALTTALTARADLIFLITDAAELRNEDVNAITQRNKNGATIHVVELTKASHTTGSAMRLALSNGGSYRRIAPHQR